MADIDKPQGDGTRRDAPPRDRSGGKGSGGGVRTATDEDATTERSSKSRISDVQDPGVPGGHMDPMDYDYTNFYFGSGDDPFALLEPFEEWWEEVHPRGYYQYELPIHTAPATRVDVKDTKTGELREGLINFASYNYLGLSDRPEVKEAIKEAAEVYGGGASG